MCPCVGIEGLEDVALQSEDGDRGRKRGEKNGCKYIGGEGAHGGVGPEGGARQEPNDEELDERALFVEGVHHVDVEHRRVVEAAGGVVEEDEGVLEEPGIDEKGEGNADEPRPEGECQQQGKNDNDGNRATAGGSQEVTQQIQRRGANGNCCGAGGLWGDFQNKCLE